MATALADRSPAGRTHPGIATLLLGLPRTLESPLWLKSAGARGVEEKEAGAGRGQPGGLQQLWVTLPEAMPQGSGLRCSGHARQIVPGLEQLPVTLESCRFGAADHDHQRPASLVSMPRVGRWRELGCHVFMPVRRSVTAYPVEWLRRRGWWPWKRGRCRRGGEKGVVTARGRWPR